ncbi:MAG: alkene reductase [Pseudomonadales bacterium]|nr:alkene reductase [Pseudomonadales bacterium]
MPAVEKLLQAVSLGDIELKNRVVMAPMTRSRAADDDLVGDLHVEYYAQRASAGLIITEGTQPSRDGKGYNRTPGIYNNAQAEAWQRVTDAVHERDGKIVCQIMHCGRVGSPLNKHPDAELVAPSAIRCREQIFTEQGMQDMPEPRALDSKEIPIIVEQYKHATIKAFDAGFDGVELHCTSGYLPAQFLSTGTNQREDEYGGSLKNRLHFVLEVLEAMISVQGSGRVGMRICPGNPFNDLHDDDPAETFAALLEAVNRFELAYLHVIRRPDAELDNIALAQERFDGPLIVNESYDASEAEQAVSQEKIAAVSFGRHYIGNPDLVTRFAKGAELARFDAKKLYTAGPEGYIDYPPLHD